MTYDEQIAVIEADLHGKLHRRDWHGVMDCAADIRELEAAKRGYEVGIKENPSINKLTEILKSEPFKTPLTSHGTLGKERSK